jgi:hypothetical protein
LADVVLHQCIRPLIGALLPAIMDISARAISLADRPQWAIWVTIQRARPFFRGRWLFGHERFRPDVPACREQPGIGSAPVENGRGLLQSPD